MSSSKKAANGRPVAQGFSVHPKLFLFFDKRTGTPRFQVRARQDGSLPVEQAVSLLAVQCIARQKMPREFGILVGTDEDLVSGLVGRTMKVIESCSNAKPRTSLSLRQDQVLAGITQNLSNKEIAARLNISERTVKFHVSALLQKFDVRGRVDLMLEAANIVPHEAVHPREQKIQRLPAPVAVAPAPMSVRGRPQLATVAANSARRICSTGHAAFWADHWKGASTMDKRALIVDDEPATCQLIEKVLGSVGMDSLWVTKSVEAPGILQHGKFAMVFLDDQMPFPDGPELTRQMRDSGRNRITPIVMMSDDKRPAAMSRGFEAGVSFFMYKPLDRDRLLMIVRATHGAIEHEQRRTRPFL